MKTQEELLLDLSHTHFDAFDTPSDDEFLKLYITKVLGLEWTLNASVMLKTYNYASLERAKRDLIRDGAIVLSEKNINKRYKKESKVRASVKEKKKAPLKIKRSGMDYVINEHGVGVYTGK